MLHQTSPGTLGSGGFSLWKNRCNVILTAEVEFISEWPEYYDDNDVEIEVQPPSFDSSIMREYVVEHSVELRDYVLNVILEA